MAYISTTKPAGIELRHICTKLHLIKTWDEKDYWLVGLVRWHEQHKDFINEKSFNADSSRYDMFRYLDNPRIPKTTNGPELFFGHLKGNLNIHRGISQTYRKEFILWYLYLKNKREGNRFLNSIIKKPDFHPAMVSFTNIIAGRLHLCRACFLLYLLLLFTAFFN